jgi:WD40 repeat protein
MSRDEHLAALLRRWEEGRRRGPPPSAEDLCRDTPELLEELRQRIAVLTETLTDPHNAPLPLTSDVTLAAPTDPTPSGLHHAVVVPGYDILDELGHGGMGVVYRARQTKANRVVALKMILSRAHATLEQRVRFRIEGEAIARLHHPNIVQLYEVGEYQGLPFFSLEFCEGGGIDRKLTGQPLPVEEGTALVETLARAMHYAHQRGVVHRDLKPANVLLRLKAESGTTIVPGDTGDRPAALNLPLSKFEPKITDFGLAKQMDSASDLSRTGAVMGTPSYMAPEQAEGKVREIGPAADVWALGAILFEFLTGRPPFTGESALSTLRGVLTDDAPPPSRLRPGTPRDLDTICLKCLQKEPGKRYITAEALAEDLRRYRAGEPITARRVSWLERAAKWVRRRPAISALLLTLVAVIGTAVGLVTWEWRREKAAHANAVKQQQLAEKRKEVAEKQKDHAEDARKVAESDRYLHLIAVADREYEAGDRDEALQVLRSCEPDQRRWEWHYLHRLVQAQVFSRLRRGPGVDSPGPPEGWNDFATAGTPPHPEILRLDPALSPDHKRLAWPRTDGKVLLLDAATGKEIRRLDASTAAATDAAFSHDGKLLAVACWDHLVKIFDASTGDVVCTCTGHAAPVTAVTFGPTGKRVFSAGSDGVIKVWDAATGKEIRTMGPTNGATALAVSRDGAFLAAGGYRYTAGVWDLATGKLVLTLPNNKEPVRAVAFSADGAWLATGSDDRTVKLFSLEKGEHFGLEYTSFRGHTGSVSRLAFGGDGKYLASCSGRPVDGEIKVWDLKGWREIRYLAHFSGEIVQTTFIPGKRLTLTLAVGPAESVVSVRDPSADKPLREFRTDTTAFQSVAADRDGTYVAVAAGRPDRADEKFSVKVYRIDDGKEAMVLSGPGRIAHAVALSPDGTRLATASLDGELKLWEVPSGKEVASIRLDGEGRRPPVPHLGPGSVAFSADGRLVAAVNADGTIDVWDVTTPKSVQHFPGHSGRVYAVAFDPRDRFLVSAADVAPAHRAEPPLKVWSLEKGGAAYKLRGLTGGQHGIAFSPDGERLVSAGEFGRTHLWEANTGRLVLELRDLASSVNGVAFSPDGAYLLTGEKAGFLILWDGTAEK